MASSPELQIALLEGKADPTVVDSDGNTLLHTAKTSELMTRLLTAGLDPNATNKVKQTFLFFRSSAISTRAHVR